MRALTLRHPWPFAISHMGKDVENRSWECPAWLFGKWIAIHGGAVPSTAQSMRDLVRLCHHLVDVFGLPAGFDDSLTAQQMIRPGVVCLVRPIECVTASDSPWFDGSGYGWVLERNVIVLPEPVSCRGAQGLWMLPPDVESRVVSQVKAMGEVLVDA